MTTLGKVAPPIENLIGTEAIEALWRSFARAGNAGGPLVTLEGLAGVMADLGQAPEDTELRHLLEDCNATEGLGEDQFTVLMASLCGDTRARLEAAFNVFDADDDGRITLDELHGILACFGMRRTELEVMLAEADQEGEGTIGLEAFCALMPEPGSHCSDRYRDSAPARAAQARTDEKPFQPGAAAHETHPPRKRSEPGQTTSRLQMQVGLFRLLQGAAYRCFRENCAANYETHLRAKVLPYTITHFVEFADKAIALYKALGIVEPECHPVLDAVPRSLSAEFARLEDRIANWPSVDKSAEMQATAEAMAAAQNRNHAVHHMFAAAVDCALTLRRKNLSPADLGEGALEIHEMNRLRDLDLEGQSPPSPQTGGTPPADHLKAWNRVILQSVDEEIDGAMMPAAYWYDDFMPKLLAACTVSSADDIPANLAPDAEALDRWFEKANAAGEFHPFAEAVAERFARCTPLQKLEIRQAWRLTRHYLNGVQKRRERLEFGRETGFLSEYVAFLDVYLGRNDVRDAQMRVSFPYYIGPATWRFLHTAAEIISAREPVEQARLVTLFKDFFRVFATMYPCPYCRYHLNRYVVCNREVDTYPLEYLILGAHPERGAILVSIEDKLEAVRDGKSLRLFLWKLHNAVSSSIARTEPWFHRDQNAPYTTRHWPSLSAEHARAQALAHGDISAEMRAHIITLDGPIERLAALRDRLKTSPKATEMAALMSSAKSATRELETALSAGAFLESTYRFDPNLVDDAPHFTPEEEAFARSGQFLEA